MTEAYLNKKTLQIEGAHEAINENKLEEGWAMRIMNALIYGNKKVHKSLQINLNEPDEK